MQTRRTTHEYIMTQNTAEPTTFHVQ